MIANKFVIFEDDQPEAYRVSVMYHEIAIEVLQGLVRGAVTITARDNCF